MSLKKLNTTYIDCMMIHSIGHPRYGGIERIQNPAIYEAWDEAKRLGKIRFTGASSHGVRMIEEMNWGLDNNRFDVILIGANFLTHGRRAGAQEGPREGRRHHRHEDDDHRTGPTCNIRALQNEHTNARQACLKWVLASDLFDTLVVSMRNYEPVDEYLAVSGTTTLTAEDRRHLDLAEASIGPRYCRPGCSGCHEACPRGVPVADILRYKMYFENYGDEKFAMQRYAMLPASARPSGCEGCPAPCEAACPYGLRIRDRLRDADRQLRFA